MAKRIAIGTTQLGIQIHQKIYALLDAYSIETGKPKRRIAEEAFSEYFESRKFEIPDENQMQIFEGEKHDRK